MKDCNGLTESCTGTAGPIFDNPSDKNTSPCAQSLIADRDISANSIKCDGGFNLQNNGSNDFVEGVVEESLNIGGADLNVYKLLGVHEQGQLVDCTGRGKAISNGDTLNFPSSNAFDKFITEWRSIQEGDGVIPSAFIGYDFGNINTKSGYNSNESRPVYGIETNIFKEIGSIAIKQSSDSNRRVTVARIERSNDGKKWFGVSVVNFPDDDCLNTILFKSSVPSRFWRIRPLNFNGANTNDPWSVVALQLFKYIATDIDNIQDKVLLENRDRDYADDEITVKGYYDLVDNLSELSAFGIEIPTLSLYITVSFSSCVRLLGRPLVIGDILEIPSEAQYSSTLKKILKWMEVTDVSWSPEGYTPGWRPTLLRIVAQPAYASQETQDIFGDLDASAPDDLGSVTGGDGNSEIFQDYFDVSQTLEAEARDAVPERGAEASSVVRDFTQEEKDEADAHGVNISKIGLNPRGLYVEDAMPPNNAPFTEGDDFPPNPKHGEYHRMTYSGLSKDIPARLYRYSDTKDRWLFMETDLRALYNPAKPTLQEFITSPNAVDEDSVTQDREQIDDDCEES